MNCCLIFCATGVTDPILPGNKKEMKRKVRRVHAKVPIKSVPAFYKLSDLIIQKKILISEIIAK